MKRPTLRSRVSQFLGFVAVFMAITLVASRVWRQPGDRSMWPIVPVNNLFRWHGSVGDWVAEFALLIVLVMVSWFAYRWLRGFADMTH